VVCSTNLYAYVDGAPKKYTDPDGKCPCSGGTWDQKAGDFQVNVGAGVYLAFGNVSLKCRSKPSVQRSGLQFCVGAGTPNVGVSWTLGGVVFGANDSSDLSGWSGSGLTDGWILGVQGGIWQGQVDLSGKGGSGAAGAPRGKSAALFRCTTHNLRCNCPSC
jgi:hypothetical protein